MKHITTILGICIGIQICTAIYLDPKQQDSINIPICCTNSPCYNVSAYSINVTDSIIHICFGCAVGMNYNVSWKFPNGTKVSSDDDYNDDFSMLDIDENAVVNSNNNNNEQTVADSLNIALLHMSIHDIKMHNITCHFESDTGIKSVKILEET